MHYGIPRSYAERRSSAASYQNECHHVVRVSEDLLKPFCVGVDPEIQRLRAEEREQMKHLNNQFACFIEKVRCLQQRNQVLANKWHFLQKQVAPPKRDLKPLFENCISNLGKQLDFLMSKKEQIEAERHKIRQKVEEFKSKYEEEIKQRMATENDFVLLKKDVDSAFMDKVKLEAKATAMKGEIEFLRCVHNEEIALLQEQIQEATILMQMDNRQDLDVTSVLQNVESWYQSVAQRSKEEANVLYRSKYQELKKQRCQMYQDLKTFRCEIGKLSWMVQRLKSETERKKKQVACLKSAICDAQQRGSCSLKDAQDKQDELYGALQNSKDDLACLRQSYQKLLQDKMALDIEITTYKSLLEGEETRSGKGYSLFQRKSFFFIITRVMVRSLEKQNKALETKWNLLQEYALPARKNLEPYYENFISNMKKEIDSLLSEREHLARENDAVQHLVEELKSK
uniref:Keratin, type II cytoskeletal 73-like n=1 Tax=Pogona vitticeps TaxID=103695 RepID=A0ABM5FCQ8_9SAUR